MRAIFRMAMANPNAVQLMLSPAIRGPKAVLPAMNRLASQESHVIGPAFPAIQARPPAPGPRMRQFFAPPMVGGDQPEKEMAAKCKSSFVKTMSTRR